MKFTSFLKTLNGTVPGEHGERSSSGLKPVILPSDAERVWLDPTISKEHALSLLEPYPADLMLALPLPHG